MAARALMSGANLALYALDSTIGGPGGALPVTTAIVGIALALTVLLDVLWIGARTGWPATAR